MNDKPMTWKQASKKLQEILDRYDRDWSPQYKEAVRIGIERIQEVEDLQHEDDV